MSRRAARILGAGAAYAILAIYLTVVLFPIVWTFLTSMKQNIDIYANPPVWWPGFQFEAYVRVFTDRPFLKYMENSTIIAISVSLLCIVIGTFAGFGLSRDRSRLSGAIFAAFVSSRAIPPIALLIPFVVLAKTLVIYDTIYVMVIAGLFLWLPFVTWLMKSQFDTIPIEVMEAARVDGASQLQSFRLVALPLVRGGLISSAVLTFVYTWNEFLFALALTSAEARTLPVGLTDFFLDASVLWNQLAAGTIIAILPPVILVIVLHKQVIGGMLEGAVKG